MRLRLWTHQQRRLVGTAGRCRCAVLTECRCPGHQPVALLKFRRWCRIDTQRLSVTGGLVPDVNDK
jgi:hypothetical protein